MKREPKTGALAGPVQATWQRRILPMDRAFSLLEVLVVIAIILILTTMYWRNNSDSRPRQQAELCQKNLEKIFIAMEIYANDHAGKFPELTGATNAEEPLDKLVPRYTVDTSVFICPGSKDLPLPPSESFSKGKISYAYYMGRKSGDAREVLMTDKQVDAKSKMAGQTVFSPDGAPPGNNHSKAGGNFLFCDGHAQPSPARAPFSIMLTQGVVLLNPK